MIAHVSPAQPFEEETPPDDASNSFSSKPAPANLFTRQKSLFWLSDIGNSEILAILHFPFRSVSRLHAAFGKSRPFRRKQSKQ